MINPAATGEPWIHVCTSGPALLFIGLTQHHRERQQTKPYQCTQAHAGNHVGRKMDAQINTGQADAKGESGEEARQGAARRHTESCSRASAGGVTRWKGPPVWDACQSLWKALVKAGALPAKQVFGSLSGKSAREGNDPNFETESGGVAFRQHDAEADQRPTHGVAHTRGKPHQTGHAGAFERPDRTHQYQIQFFETAYHSGEAVGVFC